MKENGFKLAKERNRRYPTQTTTDTDYADDIELLANTLTQAESLLHILERAAAGIGLNVNADKTEYLIKEATYLIKEAEYFNQRGDISTLNGSSLKLVDKFIYH